jgi:negative regulator of sigma E activity
VAVGARLAHLTGRSAPKAAWPQRATIVLAVECVLLAAVILVVIVKGRHHQAERAAGLDKAAAQA